MSASGVPRARAVSVGAARPLTVPGGRQFLSGIAKQPVDGPVGALPLGLAGD